MVQDWQKYNKLIVAFVGAVLTTLTVVYPTNQWVTIVVTFLTALGVYTVPNKVV